MYILYFLTLTGDQLSVNKNLLLLLLLLLRQRILCKSSSNQYQQVPSHAKVKPICGAKCFSQAHLIFSIVSSSSVSKGANFVSLRTRNALENAKGS